MLIRSVTEYARTGVGALYLKITNVERLETAQQAVVRAITNLMSTTPREVVQKKANLPPLR